MSDKTDPIPPSPSKDDYDHLDLDFENVFTSDDPIELFKIWLAKAREVEPINPNAMTLATVDKAGVPNARIVLLKTIDERGATFFTNTESVKGDELKHAPSAALCFYWRRLARQIRLRGSVEPTTVEEADKYFASRARGAQIGAWASDQSRELAEMDRLKARVDEFGRKYEGQDVPRPAHWSGYRVVPKEIEFWVERPFRLHERLVFALGLDGEWGTRRIYP